ncbi:hypothetical protein C9927_03565 [Pseudidiomarina aestuarii]|uniref:Glycosyl transferase family 1 domain-containing protein n=1 Tax=Pseudidiomarina aestuarii TaxID=624146 RepID=A0A2T4D488_9GAMM|nr:hypothetical protein C9927_03565 [Pseudidiomarina aestuarii]
MFNLPFSLHALIKARNKFEDVDLIHVNEVSDIPLAILAKMIFKVPVVLHARSILVVECRSLRIKVLRYLIQRYIDKIIAIDSNVAATVPNVCQVEVINNSFTVDYSMNDVEERLIKRRSNDKPLIFGFVGNIIKSKGIFELVQACLMLKNDSKNFKLIVAGGSLRELGYFKKLLLGFTGINQDCLVAVNDFVTNNRLETVVEFKGHIDEIADFYKEVDVIMFPSSLDAPGRPIFEAGFFGVPSIACIRKTYPDTFMDGVTGIAIPHNHPTEIATAMNNFICNKELVGEMGLAVASMSRKFNDPTVNARKVSRIYEKLVIR